MPLPTDMRKPIVKFVCILIFMEVSNFMTKPIEHEQCLIFPGWDISDSSETVYCKPIYGSELGKECS